MDRYQLLNEILNAVDCFKADLHLHDNDVGQRALADVLIDRITELIEENRDYENNMPEGMTRPNRKITKIGIAVGSAYNPMDSLS